MTSLNPLYKLYIEGTDSVYKDLNIEQVNEKFHKLERDYVKITRDKTKIIQYTT